MIGSRLQNPSAFTSQVPAALSASGAPIVVSQPNLPAAPVMRQPGFFDNLGTALRQPGMSGAFLRGAGALFDGQGIGGAINAGAQYMDHRDAVDRQQQQQTFDNAAKTRGLDIQQQTADTDQGYKDVLGQSGLMQRMIQASQAAALAAHYGRSDATTAQNGAWEHDDRLRGQDMTFATAGADRQQSDTNNLRTTDASRYGTDGQVYAAGQRVAAGIASKYPFGTTRVVTKNPPTTKGGYWWGGGTTVPGNTTIVETPNAAPAGAGTPVRIASDADRARLPSGTIYVGPDGQMRRKQ